MPRGYRLFIVALIGWLSLVAVEKGYAAHSEQDHAQQQIARSLQDIAASLKKSNDSGDFNKRCERKQDNRNSQLCANWKASDEAERSADWARNTFWLGVSGSFVALLAVGAAIAAAWFAHKAITETRRIGEAQSRAYISIVSVAGRSRTTGLTIEVEVRNAGPSPALNIIVQCRFWTKETELVRTHQISDHVGAGDIKILAPLYFTAGTYDKDGYGIFYINVIYKDVFGKTDTIKEACGSRHRHWVANQATILVQRQHIAGAFDAGLEIPKNRGKRP